MADAIAAVEVPAPGKGAQRLTLVAMTLANSMILVDQTAVPLAIPHAVSDLGGSLTSGQWVLIGNVLPLAVLMVFGGRVGDQRGLRRVFLWGAVVFTASSILAGSAQSMAWLIGARVAQGTGAAFMMPMTIAIIAAVFPEKDRGRALGAMAGASAFFAALGPVLGGLITQFVDWRAVLFLNAPLAVITIALTLANVPAVKGTGQRDVDVPGLITFAIAAAGITVGLGQGQVWGWGSPATLGFLGVGVLGVVAFLVLEPRQANPLVRFSLFRNVDFTAANISQFLAGTIELGAGLLLPYFLLLVIGLSPATAGLVLIPATVPIILVAPLAGRWFDRVGGRVPLTVGYLVLAASCLALATGFAAESIPALVPGLVLQGIGLGIVLTVNDPTGINAVPEEDRGQGSGVISTSEQFGGAVGIAVFMMLFLTYYYDRLFTAIADKGIDITARENARAKDFVLQAEQDGREQVRPPRFLGDVIGEFESAHVAGYRFVFVTMAAVAIVGAVVSFFLVRRKGSREGAPVAE